MGRLVKSPANQARAERRQFDEEQFLRDAGALASRLQSELQQGSGQGAEQSSAGLPAGRSPLSSELAATLIDVAARDLAEPGSQAGPSDEDLGITVETIGGEEPQLRVFAPKDEADANHADTDAPAESTTETTLPRSEVRGIRDQIEREREDAIEAEEERERQREADRAARAESVGL